jgi:hypothetical protein
LQARRELQQQMPQQQTQQRGPATSQQGQQQPSSVAIPTKPLNSAAVAAATRSSASSGTAVTGTDAAAAGTAAIHPVTGAGAAGATAGAASTAGGATASQVADPLHDDSAKAAKEAAQLAALSRVVQQQQDTISRQVGPRLAQDTENRCKHLPHLQQYCSWQPWLHSPYRAALSNVQVLCSH